MAAPGRGWRFAAPVALAGCGVLLVISARAADGTDLRPIDHTDVADLVRAEERHTAKLTAEHERLAAEDLELLGAAGIIYFALPAHLEPSFLTVLAVFLASFSAALASLSAQRRCG